MKNIIPLVVAVILGLVAVFAVSRTLAGKDDSNEQKVDVVAASRMLDAGEALSEGFIYARSVAVSSLPKQHVKWNNRNMILGQKLVHSVAKGDYVLLSDVGGVTLSKGNIIGDGEWGVPVSFADSALPPSMRRASTSLQSAGT